MDGEDGVGKRVKRVKFSDRAYSSRGTPYDVDDKYKQPSHTKIWIGRFEAVQGVMHNAIEKLMRSDTERYNEGNYIENYEQAKRDLEREYEENAKNMNQSNFIKYAVGGAGLAITLAILARCSGIMGGKRRKCKNKTLKRKTGGGDGEQSIQDIMQKPAILNILQNDECPNDPTTKKEVNELIDMLIQKNQSGAGIRLMKSKKSIRKHRSRKSKKNFA